MLPHTKHGRPSAGPSSSAHPCSPPHHVNRSGGCPSAQHGRFRSPLLVALPPYRGGPRATVEGAAHTACFHAMMMMRNKAPCRPDWHYMNVLACSAQLHPPARSGEGLIRRRWPWGTCRPQPHLAGALHEVHPATLSASTRPPRHQLTRQRPARRTICALGSARQRTGPGRGSAPSPAPHSNYACISSVPAPPRPQRTPPLSPCARAGPSTARSAASSGRLGLQAT